jgi:adenine-specific DNA-methyltransferase
MTELFLLVLMIMNKNMKKLCDEVFGDRNFVAQLVWQRAFFPKNDAKYISISHDYVIMYAKNIDDFKIGEIAKN